MKNPLSVRIVKGIFVIKILLMLVIAILSFVFLFVSGSPESLFYNFKEGFLNSAGYNSLVYDGNAVARMLGTMALPLAISYLNINAINRKKISY